METRISPAPTEEEKAVVVDRRAPCPPGTTPLPDRRPGAPLSPPATIRRLTGTRPWGSVVNSSTAYPLSAVTVRARAHGKCSESLMGSCVTDRDGGFRVVFDDDPCVIERLLLLELDAAQCIFEVEWSERGSTTSQCPFAGSTAFPLTLKVPLPYAALADERWRELGTTLEECRIAQIISRSAEDHPAARRAADLLPAA